MTRDLIIPIVHNNGTSADELLALRETFYAAITDAERVLCAMAPNGRDYYPVHGSMEKALLQHRRRLNVLAELLAEMEEECRQIQRADG